MAKRGRPKKIRSGEDMARLAVAVNPPQPEPDDIAIEGIPANQYDVEEELESMEVDIYHEESARFGRNPDDAQGGVGLNFGDW